ncbi:MAG TPA: LacI family DNA-binding transcriptional regulator [Ruania sp.]|nr:LacI family DNA-binding transcriptional regulator [Ruania sp.]
MAKRPTLAELASNLGISANTASRALTGRDGVSQRTRELVHAEARRIGYLARQAEIADERRSKRIALTIPSPMHAFSAELLAAIEAGARAADRALDVYVTDENAAREREISHHMRRSGVAGVIAIPVQHGDQPWGRLINSGVPVVMVSRELEGIECDYIGVDSEAGQYAATRHLLHQGCRSLVILDEDLDITTVAHRRHGFDRAIAETVDARGEVLSVPSRRFEAGRGSWRAEEAYRACGELLTTGRRPDAIAAGDDDFALGALRALSEAGMQVPGDVSVVGYGDHTYSAWTSPALTSVKLPSRVIGEVAVAQLLQRLAGDSSPTMHRKINPELVIRASTLRP